MFDRIIIQHIKALIFNIKLFNLILFNTIIIITMRYNELLISSYILFTSIYKYKNGET